METTCKNCGSAESSKNGRVRNKQRFKCKSCGCNYVMGDDRAKATPEAKALAVLLYGSGKSSYGFIARLFNVTRPAVLKWVRAVAGRLPESAADSELKEVEVDEMWRFIAEKTKVTDMEGRGSRFKPDHRMVCWRSFY